MASSSSLSVPQTVSSILSKLLNRNQEEAETKEQQADSDPSSAAELELVAERRPNKRGSTFVIV